MIYRFLTTLVLFAFFSPTNASMYCNFTKLRDDAEAFSERIWEGLSHSREKVERYLNFLEEGGRYDNRDLCDRYYPAHQEIKYDDLLTDSILNETPKSIAALRNFVTICEDIIASQHSAPLKIRATQMLFSSVVNKLREELLELHPRYPILKQMFGEHFAIQMLQYQALSSLK